MADPGKVILADQFDLVEDSLSSTIDDSTDPKSTHSAQDEQPPDVTEPREMSRADRWIQVSNALMAASLLVSKHAG
jgi:hypothetical protein